jgi:4-hydroxybenzoate polyprenyltransferase
VIFTPAIGLIAGCPQHGGPTQDSRGWIGLSEYPCLAALIQASLAFPAFRQLLVFSLGALLMRSTGSTINDIADRKFDAHVERTRFRPLAGGQLQTHKALVFLIVELALSASLLIFDPIYALSSRVCSSARIYLSVLQAIHPLAPSRFGSGVQLGNADGMG